jgi:hypothetical protein
MENNPQMTLHGLAQQTGPGELHDSKFMPAVEKRRVLRQWKLFLESGLQREKFTHPLYNHLIQNCSFIAHYDLGGFYSTYFENGDDTVNFLSQFDDRKGMPKSVEYGWTAWLTDEDYYDINIEMVRIAAKYIPALIEKAENEQRSADITQAEALLAKHGIKIDLAERRWTMSEARKGVYTLGAFKELLSKRIAKDGAEGVNIQGDQALELLNECLPRNLLFKKLFLETKEGESIMDTLPLRNSGKDFIVTDHEERG